MTVAATTQTQASGSTVSAASGQTQLNGDYNTFLSLLTAQLKNQDPLSPMDTNTFTQQLVSMNGVQQQLLTNDLLQKLVSQSSGVGSVGGAVGVIGKSVMASGSDMALQNGSAAWTYALAGNAASANLEVLDTNGKVVWSGAAPASSNGQHAFTWNGQQTTGPKLSSGTYTLKVSATDSAGQAIASSTYVKGVVTGVQTSGGTTQLNLGSTLVDYANLVSVTNP